MRTRDKILLVIAAAWLLYWVWETFHLPSITHCEVPAEFMDAAHSRPRMGIPALRAQYIQNNKEFFNDRLPTDVIIDFEEHEPNYMAGTQVEDNGQFHIMINPDMAPAERTEQYLLLHEACHIATWDEANYPDRALPPTNAEEHGPKWRACMLKIDAMGGFRRILIDYYGGN